jgi:hypothetical protein
VDDKTDPDVRSYNDDNATHPQSGRNYVASRNQQVSVQDISFNITSNSVPEVCGKCLLYTSTASVKEYTGETNTKPHAWNGQFQATAAE